MTAYTGPPECTCDPLHKIPKEIMDDMKHVAGYYGWYHANTIQNKHDDAKGDMVNIEKYYDSFVDYGLITTPTCQIYRDMADYCSKSTANERSGDGKVAQEYKGKSQAKRAELVASKEIDGELAENLWQLCWHSGWRAANERKIFGTGWFHGDDAKRDEANMELYYNKCVGDCRLIELKFFGDAAQLINPKHPEECGKQKLINKSDCCQKMCAKFSTSQSVTKSWSTTVKWNFTVVGAVGAAYVAAGGIAGSISYTKSTTEGESRTETKTQTAEFPIEVGPHSQLEAVGIVQRAEAEVPYFMVFDIGGKRYCKSGIWRGILASNIESHIGQTLPCDD